MRKGLIVLLSLGVVVGFGSGFARMAHRGGGCHERWGNRYDGPNDGYGYGRYDRGNRFERNAAPVAAPVAAPAPAPAAAAPAPVYIVIPAPAAQAPVIVNNAPAPAAAPAAIPQPAPAAQ
jgi:hypothetical protein